MTCNPAASNQFAKLCGRCTQGPDPHVVSSLGEDTGHIRDVSTPPRSGVESALRVASWGTRGSYLRKPLWQRTIPISQRGRRTVGFPSMVVRMGRAKECGELSLALGRRLSKCEQWRTTGDKSSSKSRQNRAFRINFRPVEIKEKSSRSTY